MLHAKTAVADGRWARVGSTNLNVTSWLGNRELDVIVEDEPFAKQMEAMFADDLGNATEIVLDARNRVRAPRPATGRPPLISSRGSSGGRAVAGAFRIGSTVSAAVTDRRVLEPIEAHIALIAGTALVGLVALRCGSRAGSRTRWPCWPRGRPWPCSRAGSRCCAIGTAIATPRSSYFSIAASASRLALSRAIVATASVRPPCLYRTAQSCAFRSPSTSMLSQCSAWPT